MGISRVYPLINDDLRNPLLSGALIAIALIAPFTEEHIQEEKLASYMKEINVMRSERFDAGFNFSAFFGNSHLPVHDSILPNPRMADIIYDALRNWREKVSKKLVYPTLSTKLLPDHALKYLDRYDDFLPKPHFLSTPATLERIRTEIGIDFSGPVQTSQRWYMNGLTPRTYFVAGEDAFTHARYLKGIFNDLVDCLSVTNKFNRVNPGRLHIPSRNHHVLFYDLTSFTSNMGSQFSFLMQLADWVEGDEVTLMDPVDGYLQSSLSGMIRDYALELNHHPEYTVKEDWVPDDGGLHGVAGFLGVVGNIATCNFIHGAILLMLAESESCCSCAGDDAVFIYDASSTSEDVLITCISLLGILQTEKVYRSADGEAVYLKRGVEIREGYDGQHFIYLRKFIQFPSFILFADNQPGRWREQGMTREQLLPRIAGSLSAFFNSVADVSAFDSFSLVQCSTFIRRFYDLHSFPHDGLVPLLKGKGENPLRLGFIPNLRTLGFRDFIPKTVVEAYRGSVELPDREWHDDSSEWIIRPGHSFWAYPSPTLSLLVRLGVVQMLFKRRKWYYGEDGLSRLMVEVDRFGGRKAPQPYFYVVGEIPRLMHPALRHVEVLDLEDPYPGLSGISGDLDPEELKRNGIMLVGSQVEIGYDRE